MRRHSPHRQKQPECLRMLVFVALPAKRSRRSSSSTHTTSSFPQVRRPSTTGPPGSGPRRAVVVINSRIVARLDRKRLGAQYWGKAESRSEAFSMSRLEGTAGVCGGRGRCRWLWNLNGHFFAFCSGPNVNAGTSKAAEKKSRYHLIRGGLSHAQRPPRQRLRSSRQPFLNHACGSVARHLGPLKRRFLGFLLLDQAGSIRRSSTH